MLKGAIIHFFAFVEVPKKSFIDWMTIKEYSDCYAT